MTKTRFPRREHPAIIQRRNRAYMAALVPDERRERYEKEFPESNLIPLPRRRATVARVGPSEHQEQVAVIQWWGVVCHGYGLPVIALFAVPNGGARDAITGSRLKAEGVRPGALDLILAKPAAQFHGLFLEMKVGRNRATPEQDGFVAYLNDAGYSASVHWSADSAINRIKEYLA